MVHESLVRRSSIIPASGAISRGFLPLRDTEDRYQLQPDGEPGIAAWLGSYVLYQRDACG